MTTSTPGAVRTDSVLDSPSPADTATADRAREKADLIAFVSVLKDRMEALEDLIEAKQARLSYLMGQDGERKMSHPAGTASFVAKRSVSVSNAKIAAEKLDQITLAEYFRPTTALVDALSEAGMAFGDFLSVETKESFEVRRSTSRESKEYRGAAIERTKAETEATVRRIVERMHGRREPGSPPTTPHTK